MRTLLKLTLIASALIAAAAVAQEQGRLNVRTVVKKEEVTVNQSGETERRLVGTETVVPGDDIVYTITFTNVSDETADKVVITNPISDSTTYVDGSASCAGAVIEFSVDGGRTFGAADELVVATNREQRPAQAEDFTHVRWTMQNELESGAQGLAQFRARLN